MWITEALILHNAIFFARFSFQTLELVISIVPLTYTAMVRHFEQFLDRNFNEKNYFYIFPPSFCLPPKLLSYAIKSGFKLSAAKLVYSVSD